MAVYQPEVEIGVVCGSRTAATYAGSTFSLMVGRGKVGRRDGGSGVGSSRSFDRGDFGGEGAVTTAARCKRAMDLDGLDKVPGERCDQDSSAI